MCSLCGDNGRAFRSNECDDDILDYTCGRIAFDSRGSDRGA